MAVAKLTVSMPADVLTRVNDLAREYDTTRSAIAAIAAAEYLLQEEQAESDTLEFATEEAQLAEAVRRGWLTADHLALAVRISRSAYHVKGDARASGP